MSKYGTISPQDYYGENPDIYRELADEVMQDGIADLVAKGMTEDEAIQFILDNPV